MAYGDKIRGRVWKSPGHIVRFGKRIATWNYEVTVNGVIVVADNCADYNVIQQSCNQSVLFFRGVLHLGYDLTPNSWRDLVERAREEL